ncbi:hypothetical protein LEMLEM_LOCUS23002 [Lemmus lemmus]
MPSLTSTGSSLGENCIHIPKSWVLGGFWLFCGS